MPPFPAEGGTEPWTLTRKSKINRLGRFENTTEKAMFRPIGHRLVNGMNGARQIQTRNKSKTETKEVEQ